MQQGLQGAAVAQIWPGFGDDLKAHGLGGAAQLFDQKVAVFGVEHANPPGFRQ
ncbi:hypothetical protein D3C85_1641290 [compost metagenome]